jgi:hypothetical protein
MGEAAGEHEGDLGGLHRVLVDINAEEVSRGNARGQADFRELAFVLGEEAQEQALFEFPQGAVGDEEEVAGAAGGVEDAELAEFLEQGQEVGSGPGGRDAFVPGTDNGGADDLLDVGFVGEMGAQGVAFLFAEAGLEEGAEDDGLDVAPVVLVGGGKEGAEFGQGLLDGV